VLPDGPVPAAPVSVTAEVKDGLATVAWAPVAGVRMYTIGSSDNANGPFRTIVDGLTSTSFSGIPVEHGATYFVVRAVNSNGVSGDSMAANVMTEKAAAVERIMVMH
jgi:hypothetical protein